MNSTKQCHGRSYFSFSLASVPLFDSLPFTTQKVQTTTNSPSFSISLDALWETSAAIRPMFIQGSLIVPSPYLRIPSTADQTPWTVCLPCPILARLAMPSLSSFCFHDQPEVFMMLSKLPVS
ncbi:hypothetical protein CABS01_14399 [Colletotrichum abscissum]|uniref:Uncharacterized protein n=3 Tax=Colletotrichum acutatum species complex TaxID=2707335 RepID=A0A9P9X221_9PEZI|nr:uncharacterized protein CTAM01_06755 [Colletotrichum tamarilloi]XP_060393445.1 uncharacterized protein CABS01_14399 [Colletotrichum abscissum]KAK1449668.1 hypothetical protein CMEL01_07004 [Colletotrichum melonis]KAK1708992.1 hypothetical protein BDP67DRAFT_122235 [Colletotrichum lupini]KAI3531860.1 hypothetical protein CABS02_14050 [Colletotrichum abscissum]KAK1480873.1 hypothetical protein CABS01_14399 [Colletotrichum abscissum]KAK1500156.1 hypothetical protein CTAM01_06755 [Colletotrich